MTDNERLRAFAQSLIDEAGEVVAECGVAGGHVEVARAEIARKLIELLDALPSPTSPERIPPLVLEGLERYRNFGLRPGAFLYAVLAGELFPAFERADEPSMLCMPAIVAWCQERLPPVAYGSRGAVESWIRRPRS